MPKGEEIFDYTKYKRLDYLEDKKEIVEETSTPSNFIM